ncbi:MAG TPA: energy transducer TonB [Bacteroidales bacterium]|nr:energy transducer TonB [Bacteroidales bacterium]
MKTTPVESLEDLVFRDKNKLYGAYFLRKRYHRHITLSLLLATLLMLSALTYPLIASYRYKGAAGIDIGVTVNGTFMSHPPDNLTLPPPPPPPLNPLEKKYKFVVPKVVSSEMGDDNFGKQDILSQNQNKELPPPDEQVTTETQPVNKTIEVPDQTEPPTWVPEMPVFPGGEAELYRFLSRNLKYPGDAKDANIAGTVYLTFVVEKDGSITGVTVLRGIGGGCEEEAIRVIRSMPPWTPGKNNGIPVRVRFNLPVKFVLHE